MQTKYPYLVRIGIWGIWSRSVANIFMNLCLFLCGIHVGAFVFALFKESPGYNEYLFWAILFLIGTVHYWYCRNWIDRHGDWVNVKENWAKWWEILLALIFVVLIGALTGFLYSRIF